jgi:hypothetical protein
MKHRRTARLCATAIALGLVAYHAPQAALAATTSYTFALLATTGDPLAGGGTFVNDFEGGAISANGDIAFGADVSTGGEGIFLMRGGRIVELARTGGAAPGGGTYSGGFFGAVAQNDQGDAIFDFALDPFSLPIGVNAGGYRYSQASGTVSAFVVPFVTPAPGGGTFQGTSFQPTFNNHGDVAFGWRRADQRGHPRSRRAVRRAWDRPVSRRSRQPHLRPRATRRSGPRRRHVRLRL